MCPACSQMHAWYGEHAAGLIPADHSCDAVTVRSVSLLVDAETAGQAVHVLVEGADGTYRTVISESWPGPISHTVTASGLREVLREP